MSHPQSAPSAGDKSQDGKPKENGTPAAGPHARPDLTNKDATPGTGSLPDGEKGNEADVGAD